MNKLEIRIQAFVGQEIPSLDTIVEIDMSEAEYGTINLLVTNNQLVMKCQNKTPQHSY